MRIKKKVNKDENSVLRDKFLLVKLLICLSNNTQKKVIPEPKYLCIGDQVHLYTNNGTWTVKKIQGNTITLGYSKHNQDNFNVNIGSIKCFYGGGKIKPYRNKYPRFGSYNGEEKPHEWVYGVKWRKYKQ